MFFMDMQPVSNRCEVVVIESTDSFAYAVSYYMSVIKVLTSKKSYFLDFTAKMEWVCHAMNGYNMMPQLQIFSPKINEFVRI